MESLRRVMRVKTWQGMDSLGVVVVGGGVSKEIVRSAERGCLGEGFGSRHFLRVEGANGTESRGMVQIIVQMGSGLAGEWFRWGLVEEVRLMG